MTNLDNTVGSIVSINVGQPQEVAWQGKTVRTAIFKEPLSGPVRVRRLNIDGDAQADLTVHGGVDQAVYMFASENYAAWQARYPQLQMSWGFFGENLTTRGLLDDSVRIGNRYRMGSVECTVTVPRLPCSRLALRFQDAKIIQSFLEAQSTGAYLSVQVEGELKSGDKIELLSENSNGITIPQSVALYSGKSADRSLLQRASADRALPLKWRNRFGRRLQEYQKEG